MIAAMTAALAALLMTAEARSEGMTDIAIMRADGSKTSFSVELATDPESRERGLMFRRKLARENGMLFVYDEPGRRAFWMKDTYIPLDMLFFKKNGELVYIHPNAAPRVLDPVDPHRDDICAVLEITGGEAARRRIRVGDRLVLKGGASACKNAK
ncbi:MAG: DUF192 domain-containing protein [Rhodospirillales bacterium]|nr:DUF192 domain-containing protein [Alphaproteobacteria bacterium]MCB9987429.1 DUF192 domain-containing protein [Rhodospirillales bacterium]USO07589.1 MAG: DUF192 domain-containing protein [Rhodospirillales bacterium]